MILCSTPGCDAVLRRLPGLHQPGEPYMQSDADGSFMLCLKCGAKVRWHDDDPAAEERATPSSRDAPPAAPVPAHEDSHAAR